MLWIRLDCKNTFDFFPLKTSNSLGGWAPVGFCNLFIISTEKLTLQTSLEISLTFAGRSVVFTRRCLFLLRPVALNAVVYIPGAYFRCIASQDLAGDITDIGRLPSLGQWPCDNIAKNNRKSRCMTCETNTCGPISFAHTAKTSV